MGDYLLAIVPKKLLFSKEEFSRLSSICESIGQVLFASVVVPFFFRVDTITFSDVVLASELTAVSWLISLWLSRKSSEL